MKILFTIGHSNHPIQHFISLLRQHCITAVVDVRSAPYSKYNPHFNQDALAAELKKHGIVYVFLGKELGARPDDEGCYIDGRADYKRISERPDFKIGIDKLLRGIEDYCIALLCAEKDPIDCHRTILVCHFLRKMDLIIKHILADGSIEEHKHAESRLIEVMDLEPNLFDQPLDNSERIERAYELRAREISYKSEGGAENHETTG